MQKKEKIAITIDRELLKDVEQSAELTGLNRSQAVEMFVRMGIMMLNEVDKWGIDHVRLEQASAKKPEYQNALKYAYARAQKDLRKWNDPARVESGKPLRFNTKPPKTKTGAIDKRSLQEKINTISKFLESDTNKRNKRN